MKFTLTVQRERRRALELFHRDTPFKQRVVRLKNTYQRRAKHQQRDWGV